METGVIIGCTVLLLSLVAGVCAILLRGNKSSNIKLMAAVLWFGVAVLLLVGLAGIWNCVQTGNWAGSAMPLGMVALAICNISLVSRIGKTPDSK